MKNNYELLTNTLKIVRTFRSENELETYLMNAEYLRKYPDLSLNKLFIKRRGKFNGWTMRADEYIKGGLMIRY